jgi:hypothetical protein
MRSSQERQEALVEEVKALLKEKGKALNPEVLARLAAAQTGVVEGNASRFAGLWRVLRVPAVLLLMAFFALIFFYLTSHEPERPVQPPDVRQGTSHRR